MERYGLIAAHSIDILFYKLLFKLKKVPFTVLTYSELSLFDRIKLYDYGRIPGMKFFKVTEDGFNRCRRYIFGVRIH